jgi:hypothetical protein
MKGKNPKIIFDYQQKKRPTQIELGVFLFTFYLLLLTHFTLFFIPPPSREAFIL